MLLGISSVRFSSADSKMLSLTFVQANKEYLTISISASLTFDKTININSKYIYKFITIDIMSTRQEANENAALSSSSCLSLKLNKTEKKKRKNLL